MTWYINFENWIMQSPRFTHYAGY